MLLKISPMSPILGQGNPLFLLFALVKPLEACVPECPPCEDWNGTRCVWRCGDCESCFWGSCVDYCSSGQHCCKGSCCDSGTTCCEGDCCYSEYCETCQNKRCKSTCSSSQYCCDGTCCEDWKQCCDGTCCDPNNCEECQDGSCVDRCDPALCQQCDGQGNCPVCGSDPDKCCDNGTCVPKCDPDGGSMCTWTNPPVYDPLCEYATPEMPICINPGKTCNWEPTSGPGLNATCADCAPGCTTTEDCVVLMPILCDEGLWPLPPFYMCQCIKEPALYDPVPSGTRYVCP